MTRALRCSLALCAMLLPACAHTTTTRCAESVRTRCLTPLECSYDEARGCEVCACAPPPYVRPEQTRP